MKILQLVTLVSGVGAFGGPARVAINQCEALRARGHDTVLVAGAHELPLAVTSMGAAPVRLFPTHQIAKSKPMAYLWSPPMLRWLWRHIDEFDVVHIHLARDGISLPAAVLARRRQRPYVVQTHGMISPRAGRVQRAVDRLATLRVLRDASAVFALNDDEANLMAPLTTPSRVELLRNGIAVDEDAVESSVQVERPDFLFLARLHPRKRALLFVEAAAKLVQSGVSASFTLIGPDEGDGARVLNALAEMQALDPRGAVQWCGPITPDETGPRLARAYAYVLPSVDEPYPMSVIEALAQGRPVIVTRSNGLAQVVSDYGCGIVVPNDSVDELAAAMKRLYDDPAGAASIGRRALDAVRAEFSITAVAETLEHHYRTLCPATT